MKKREKILDEELLSEWKKGLTEDQFNKISSTLHEMQEVRGSEFKLNQLLGLENISRHEVTGKSLLMRPAFVFASLLFICLIAANYYLFPQSTSKLTASYDVDYSVFTDDYYTVENVLDDDLLLMGELL